MNLWRVTDQGKIHTKGWGKVKVGVHTMFSFACMFNSIVYYEKLGAGCDIVMLAARFSICNVFTVQHIFGTFVKGALNCNFLGSQSVKNNYKKYASSNIFKPIFLIYIREVINNFQKAFIQQKALKNLQKIGCISLKVHFQTMHVCIYVFKSSFFLNLLLT